MSIFKITFPDGNKKEFDKPTKIIDIAKSISPSLAKKCVGAVVNDIVVDLVSEVSFDSDLRLLTAEDKESFSILNHSAAHIMAQAVQRLFPNAKFAVGPAIEEGFYYDIDANNEISVDDLPRIEKEMKRIISETSNFNSKVISYEDATDLFSDDEYKMYLINKIKDSGKDITIYEQGDFTDLCRGPHIISTNKLAHFKLLGIAGAYWLGDSSNKMLQRIYGTAWFTKDDLANHLQILEDRKNNDHRKLGKELELFTFTHETGSGLPLWLPNGATIRYQLEKFIKEEELRRGYDHVYTPVLGTKQLYETSGHWEHYQDDMFAPIEMGNETFVLRPMCCPHHAMIYKHKPHSYRELPIRIAELGGMHRYEASGALTGLERVRNMCLNDGHIFARPDQIKDEFKRVIDLVKYAVEVLDLNINYYRLSLRDPQNKDKYFDDDAMWDNAEKTLREVLVDNKVDFIEATDEAAFYGPKLDIQIKTSLGHDVTLSTIQLDFLLPQRFDLNYIGEDGNQHRPVVIHRGIISTMERMTATLIEQYKGAFPLWLSPTQVNIIPVSPTVHHEYATKIQSIYNQLDVRVTLDDREEKINKKIREAQIAKIPYTLIIGDKEMNDGTVTYRRYKSEENVTLSIEEFKEQITKEISSKYIHRT